MKYRDDGSVNLDRELVRRQGGSRITEADAESQGRQIAARGRPRLTGTSRSGQSPVLTIRVTEDVRADLDRLAAERGERVSTVVRQLLEDGLATAKR